jgi:hypothetical protein
VPPQLARSAAATVDAVTVLQSGGKHRRVESLLKLLPNDSAEKCRLFCLSQQHSSEVQPPRRPDPKESCCVLLAGLPNLDLVRAQFFLPCGALMPSADLTTTPDEAHYCRVPT